MKKICVTILLAITCLTTSYAQDSRDPITMRKIFGGYQFYQGGTRLNMTQLTRVVEQNAEAYKLAKSARSNVIYSSIIGGVGGFMLGWNLGTAIGGGNPNRWVAGAGAGLIVVSIPINNTAMRQAKSAAELYNDTSGYGSRWDKGELLLSMGSQGTGIVWRF